MPIILRLLAQFAPAALPLAYKLMEFCIINQAELAEMLTGLPPGAGPASLASALVRAGGQGGRIVTGLRTSGASDAQIGAMIHAVENARVASGAEKLAKEYGAWAQARRAGAGGGVDALSLGGRSIVKTRLTIAPGAQFWRSKHNIEYVVISARPIKLMKKSVWEILGKKIPTAQPMHKGIEQSLKNGNIPGVVLVKDIRGHWIWTDLSADL